MSDSVWPHRWQPTRLSRPWDSPGKNTAVACHFLLQCVKVKSESEVAQPCPTLSDPMDCSLPGSSVHGIFQARVLEWGATAFSRWKLENLWGKFLKEWQASQLHQNHWCVWVGSWAGFLVKMHVLSSTHSYEMRSWETEGWDFVFLTSTSPTSRWC